VFQCNEKTQKRFLRRQVRSGAFHPSQPARIGGMEHGRLKWSYGFLEGS